MTDDAAAATPLWLQDQRAASEARATRWRALGFAFAAAAWSFPSVWVWFFGLVGLTGWDSDNGSTDGVLDGDVGGLAPLVFAVIGELVAVAILIAIAGWAWGRRWQAVVAGIAATTWMQALLSLSLVT